MIRDIFIMNDEEILLMYVSYECGVLYSAEIYEVYLCILSSASGCEMDLEARLAEYTCPSSGGDIVVFELGRINSYHLTSRTAKSKSFCPDRLEEVN